MAHRVFSAKNIVVTGGNRGIGLQVRLRQPFFTLSRARPPSPNLSLSLSLSLPPQQRATGQWTDLARPPILSPAAGCSL